MTTFPTSLRRPAPALSLPLRRLPWRPTALAAALALHGAAFALPEGGRPSFGQTQVTRTEPGTLRIDQTSARAGIDWRSFSVGSNELVQVVQPGSSSVLVNRVTGLDPSNILGRIDANGRVFLINPRGVIFGEGAQVNVSSLVATSLSISNADAQAGRWWLGSGEGAGAVVNLGRLNAAGGTVALVAPQVANQGSIDADRVALGAVSSVKIDLDGDGLILFDARAADAARLDHGGRITADGGRAELVALARGQVAGTVLNLRGAVFARGLGTRGGEVVIDGGTEGITVVSGQVDASGSGAGATGGSITLLGQKIGVASGAVLDASGTAGGGTLLVGGDFQGRNAALHNAEMVTVLPGARLDVSAGQSGDGGKLIVWSDEVTRFAGAADARGGAAGGDGGFVEVSGKQHLDFTGSSDRSAARGRAGTLLLDPASILIQDAAGDVDGTGVGTGDIADGDLTGGVFGFSTYAGAAPSILSKAAVTALTGGAGGALELQALDDITVAAGADLTRGSGSLTLRAGADIVIDANVNAPGGIALLANDPGGRPTSDARVVLGSGVTLNGGSGTVLLSNSGGSGIHQIAGNITGDAVAIVGDVSLAGTSTWTLSGNSTVTSTLSGTATLVKAGAGTLTLTGSNTYQGATIISAGTLQVAGSGTLGIGGIQLFAPGTLDIVGGSAVGNAVFSDGGRISTSGSTGFSAQLDGDLTLNGAATTLHGGGTGDSLTLTGTITEVGSPVGLSVTGQRVQLAGAVEHAGGTSIASGTQLNLVNTGAALALGSGAIVNDGLLVVARSDNTLLGSVISGAGSLVQQGSGTTELLGANTYTGGTTVFSGTLRIDSAGTAGTGTITMVSGAALDITGAAVVGNAISASGDFAIGSTTGGGTLGAGPALELASGSTLALAANAGSTLTIAREIADTAGSAGVQVVGAGTVAMTAASSYDGGTQVISGATLRLDSATAAAGTGLITLSDSTLSVNGGAAIANAVQVSGFSTITNATGLGTLAGGTVSLLSGTSLALSGNGTGLVVAGTIDDGGSGASVTASSGSVTLSAVNIYSGGTTLAEGATLRITGSGTAGSSNITLLANATLDVSDGAVVTNGIDSFGGTLATTSGSGEVAGPLLMISATTLSASTGASLLMNGNIAESGSATTLFKVGAGLVTLAGSSSFTSTLLVQQGVLTLTGGAAAGDASTVSVDAGATVSVATDETVGNLILHGTLDGTGTLTAPVYDLYEGTVSGRLGTGTLNVWSTATVSGTAAAGVVNVNPSGSLFLPTSGRLTASPGITVFSGGQLQLGGDETAGAFTLFGTLAGTGTLTSPTYDLYTGSVDASLGSGTVNVFGGVTLNGTAAAGNVFMTVGTLTLGAAGRFTANPTVDVDGESTLLLAGSETLGRLVGSGFVDIAAGVLSVGATGSSTFSGFISGAGGLAVIGGSSLTLTTGHSYSGGTTVSDGVLVLGSNDLLANAGDVVVEANGVLEVNGLETVGSLTLRGRLDGTGTLTAATYVLEGGTANANMGAGTLSASLLSTINGTADAGTVSIDNGTLTLGSSERLSDAAAVDVGPTGTLRLGGTETLGLISGSGSIDLGVNTLIVGDAGSSVFSGSIGGTGSLYKVGPATTLTLSGSNTYTGDTAAIEGTLALSGGSAIADTGFVTVDAAAVLQVDSDETIGTLVLLGTLNGSATLTAGSYLLSDATVNANLGTGFLTSSGSSFLNGTAAANNVSVGDGTLHLGAADRLADSADVSVASGSVLFLNGNDTVGRLTLAGTLDGTGTLTAPTYDLNGATVVADLGGGAMTVTGFVFLQGTSAANTIDVTPGATLEMESGNRLTAAPAVSVQSTGSVLLGGDETFGTLAGFGSVDLGSGVLSTGGGGDSTFSGQITSLSSGSLVKLGTGVFTLAGGTTYTGGTTVAAGTLALGGSDLLADAGGVAVAGGATLQLGGNETVATLALAGALAGSGTLTASSYTLDSGTTVLGADLGTGSLLSNGASTLGGSAAVSTLEVAGGSLTLTSSGRLGNLPAVLMSGGTLVLQGDETVSALAGSSGVVLEPGTLTVDNNTDTTYSGSLTGSGGLVKRGFATLFLGGINSYGGSTDIVDGTLATTVDGALPSGTAVSVGGGATLDIGATNQSVFSLSMVGSVTGSGSLDVGTLDMEGGGISGTLRLFTSTLNSNGGTLGVLTQASVVNVNNGTLFVTSAGGFDNTPDVTVRSPATLELSGDETVRSLSLAGTLDGFGVLNAPVGGYDFAGGTLREFVSLGAGALTSSAGGLLQGSAAVDSVTIDGGTLTMGAAGRLTNLPAITVNAGSLDLGGFGEAAGSVRLNGGSIDNGTLGSVAAFDVVSGSVSAVLDGTAGLNKTGVGSTVTLSGANTYTGTSTVAEGTLALVGSNRLASASTVLVSGGSLDIGSGDNGVAAVTMQAGSIVGSGGTLSSASAFQMQSGTASASLGGSAGLSKSGSGTVTLSGSNTFGGSTSVGAGTLRVTSAAALGSSADGTSVAAGATLQIDNADIGSEALTLAGRGVGDIGALIGTGNAQAAGSVTLAADTAIGGSGSLRLDGAIGDGGGGFALDKVGTGTLTLAAPSAHSGGTRVSAGTLVLAASNVFSDAGPLTIAGGTLDIGAFDDTVAAVTLAGGTLTGTTGVLSSLADFELQSGSVGARLGGPAGINKTTTGTVVLNGSNTFDGTARVQVGTLVVASATALGSTAGGTEVSPGATLQVDGVALGAEALQLAGSGVAGAGALLGTGTGARVGGSITLVADTAIGGTLRVDGSIGDGGNAFELQKVGLGATTLTLAGATSHTGGTRVSGGTLALAASDRLADSGALVVDGGQFDIGGFSEAVASVQLQSGSIDGSSSGVLTSASDFVLESGSASAAFAGSVGLTKTTGGTVALSGVSLYTGATTVTGGTLSLVGAQRLPTATAITVNDGATLTLDSIQNAGSLRLRGTLAGVGTLIADVYLLEDGIANAALGAGTITTTGDSQLNASAAATTVNVDSGTLALGGSNFLAGGATVFVASGATLALGGGDTITTLNLAGTLNGAGTLSAGHYNLNSGNVDAGLGSGALTSVGSSTINANAAVDTVDVGSGLLQVTAAGVLTALPLVTVQAPATLGLASDQSFGALSGAGVVDLGSAQALRTSGAFGAFGASSRSAAPAAAAAGGAILTTGDAASTTYSGSIVGNGDLVKVGTTTFTLSGVSSYTGDTVVAAGTLALAGADRLGTQTAVRVAGGATLQLGGNQTVADLVLAGTLAGTGTLTAPNYALSGGTVDANLGTGALASTGSSRLNGSAAAASVNVDGGTLTLGGADRLADTAEVEVAGGATLALNGSDTVGQLVLAGTLAGSGVFTATTYELASGSVNAALGTGSLTSRGSSALNAAAAIGSLTVADGRLDVAGNALLSAAPTVDVQTGSTLALAGTQTVGALTSAGTLRSGPRLAATSVAVAASGRVELGGTIDTSATGGNQAYDGVVVATAGNAAPALLAGSGGDIVALNAGNDFGPGALALSGRSVQLADSGALALGAVALGGGVSGITSAGVLRLEDTLALDGGTLTLTSDAARTQGATVTNGAGNAVRLPDRLSGADSLTALAYAAPVIEQAAGANLTTNAGSTLRLVSSQGGSIELANAGNVLGGALSATTGAADATFAVPQGNQGTLTASRVVISADQLNLAAAADGSGDALRADVVQLKATGITMAAGSVIRARLPYGEKMGAENQLPALAIDTAGAGAGAVFGTRDAPLTVAVDSTERATGIGGMFLTVLPAPQSGVTLEQQLFLACGTACGGKPLYEFGGQAGAVQTFFNGEPLQPPPEGSIINNNTTLLENARRTLFETSVRTENVGPRLRAGVIAEVGTGRPATEGSGGVRRPELCEGSAGTLACPGKP